jgi:hypothetical protein
VQRQSSAFNQLHGITVCSVREKTRLVTESAETDRNARGGEKNLELRRSRRAAAQKPATIRHIGGMLVSHASAASCWGGEPLLRFAGLNRLSQALTRIARGNERVPNHAAVTNFL